MYMYKVQTELNPKKKKNISIVLENNNNNKAKNYKLFLNKTLKSRCVFFERERVCFHMNENFYKKQ